MDSTISKKTISWWDWSGIFFSGLCLLHCVATPLLLASVSFWLLSEWVHVLFLIPLIPITFMASRRAIRAGQSRWPAILLILGLLVLVAALLLGTKIGEPAEIAMTIMGSLLLISGHPGNRHVHICREDS